MSSFKKSLGEKIPLEIKKELSQENFDTSLGKQLSLKLKNKLQNMYDVFYCCFVKFNIFTYTFFRNTEEQGEERVEVATLGHRYLYFKCYFLCDCHLN